MLPINVHEVHFFVYVWREDFDFVWLPVGLDELAEVGKGGVGGPDVEGVDGKVVPAGGTEEAEFGIGMVLVRVVFVEGDIGEAGGKDAVPEVAPFQEVADDTVAVEVVVAGVAQ